MVPPSMSPPQRGFSSSIIFLFFASLTLVRASTTTEDCPFEPLSTIHGLRKAEIVAFIVFSVFAFSQLLLFVAWPSIRHFRNRRGSTNVPGTWGAAQLFTGLALIWFTLKYAVGACNLTGFNRDTHRTATGDVLTTGVVDVFLYAAWFVLLTKCIAALERQQQPGRGGGTAAPRKGLNVPYQVVLIVLMALFTMVRTSAGEAPKLAPFVLYQIHILI
jgi:hypothetical protein